MTMLEAALRYACERGWMVLPVKHRTKFPGTHHGFLDATKDQSIIRNWFTPSRRPGRPEYGIGVVTGSSSGFWVLDIDGDVGRASLAELVKKYGALPRTLACRTGGGGMHLYFTMPPQGVIKSRVAIMPGIDIRGDGGYVVAPPSVHPSGKVYAWDEQGGARVLAAPAWLLALAMPADIPAVIASAAVITPQPDASYDRYAAKALANQLAAIAAAIPGARNDTLNKAAYSLGQLIGAGILTYAAVEAALIAAAHRVGLGRAEIAATVKSGLTAGMNNPSQLPKPEEHHAKPTTTPSNPTPPETGASAAAPVEAQVEAPAHPQPETADAAPNAPLDELSLKLLAAEMTDTGSAECLALLYGDELRYDFISRCWRVWRGALWQTDSMGEVDRCAVVMVRKRRAAAEAVDKPNYSAIRYYVSAENQARIRAMLYSAQSLAQFASVISQYDTNPFLACAGDQTLDLQTCVARPPQRADYITRALGAAYDKEAVCPRWLAFLGEIFSNNESLMAYIQRAVGYSLTGDTHEQKCWICVGGGSNGKSVFLTILNKLLGDYAGTTSWETFDADTSEARADLAKLYGCRIVTVIESNDDARLNEARVKSVTGGDKVTARALYAVSFDYLPTYKIWFATNHRPRIQGTDNGIWRRIQLIPFNESFEGSRRDDLLDMKLLQELPGILNWALAGLAEWHRMGLSTPETVVEATAQYRAESDIVGQWITECCVKHEQATMMVSAAYASYRQWCDQNGLSARSLMMMSRRISEHGYTKHRTVKGHVAFAGIGLLSDQ